MKKEVICTLCGHVGMPKKLTKGSFAVELLLWLFFGIGILYSIWRLSTREMVCASCSRIQIIPVDSPRGKELLSK